MDDVITRLVIFGLMVVGFLIRALAKGAIHKKRANGDQDCLSVVRYLIFRSQIKTALNLIVMATIAGVTPMPVMGLVGEIFTYEGYSLGGLVPVAIGIKSDFLIARALAWLNKMADGGA